MTLPGTIPSVAPPIFPGARDVAPTARFELRPFIGVFEDYTDNFDLATRNKRDNFRTGVTPSLSLLINQPLLKGGITGSVSGTHDSATDEFSVFYGLTGSLTWQVTPRWTLSAFDSLSRSDEYGASDRLGLRQERSPFLLNNFGLSSSYILDIFSTEQHYGFSTFIDPGSAPNTMSHTVGGSVSGRFLERHTATLGYDYLISTSTGNESDITSHTASASLARQLNPNASAGISGSYSTSTVTGGAAGGNDFRSWTASLFSSYSLPGRWSTRVSLGYSHLTPDEGKEHGGFYTSSSITYQFARASASLAVDKGFSQTFGLGQNAGVADTFGVTANLGVPLTPLLFATASGFYRETELTGVASSQTGDTSSWGGTVGLSAQLLRWLAASLDYSYRAFIPTASPGTSRDEVVENRVRLYLTASF